MLFDDGYFSVSLGETTPFPANLFDGDPANATYLSASGTHTTLSNLPIKHWFSSDCGDATEACQHNVGQALFR